MSVSACLQVKKKQLSGAQKRQKAKSKNDPNVKHTSMIESVVRPLDLSIHDTVVNNKDKSTVLRILKKSGELTLSEFQPWMKKLLPTASEKQPLYASMSLIVHPVTNDAFIPSKVVTNPQCEFPDSFTSVLEQFTDMRISCGIKSPSTKCKVFLFIISIQSQPSLGFSDAQARIIMLSNRANWVKTLETELSKLDASDNKIDVDTCA